MNIVLFDTHLWKQLRPLTDTRLGCGLRIGIDTVFEKWARHTGSPPQVCAYGHLAGYSTYAQEEQEDKNSLFVCSTLLPDTELVRTLAELAPNEGLQTAAGELLAYKGSAPPLMLGGDPPDAVTLQPYTPRHLIRAPWDLFRLNGAVLRTDFAEITAGRQSDRIADKHTAIYGQENLFVEAGVQVRAAILDAENGPIYLGKQAQVQCGAIIQGAHAIGNHAVVNMGAKLRGDSTLGPYCKVGGELSNSLLQGYSNKGHDGFVGNSVIGEWCNLGADTNTSNLKNNYGTVRVYSYATQQAEDTGMQFCGLIMGDHGKCGINTMFNTGTVVGACANIFGGNFPPKHIPAFSWGGADGFVPYAYDKAVETANRMMARRGRALSDTELSVLRTLADGSV